ncbi:hypothetical protein ABZW18_18870 [Streptomyces sp. NPDC004647]|uniref:hypothetical protein n=1 Tax=Streptomyces sp. NPDC004647 TaxID=3154671 RepID=UPI00339FCA85
MAGTETASGGRTPGSEDAVREAALRFAAALSALPDGEDSGTRQSVLALFHVAAMGLYQLELDTRDLGLGGTATGARDVFQAFDALLRAVTCKPEQVPVSETGDGPQTGAASATDQEREAEPVSGAVPEGETDEDAEDGQQQEQPSPPEAEEDRNAANGPPQPAACGEGCEAADGDEEGQSAADAAGPAAPPHAGSATSSAVSEQAQDQLERRTEKLWSHPPKGLVLLREIPGYQPSQQDILPARGSVDALARGLRVDALRLNSGDRQGLLKDIAKALGTAAPAPDSHVLPAFDAVLAQPVAGPALLHTQDADPRLMPLTARAEALIEVVREAVDVGGGLLLLEETPPRTHPVTRHKFENWINRVRKRLNAAQRPGPGFPGFPQALIQLDEVLAEIVPDPVPERNSWWQNERARRREIVSELLKDAGGQLHDKMYPAHEERSGLLEKPVVSERNTGNRILWWIRLPWSTTEGSGAKRYKGRAICERHEPDGR